MASSSSSSRIGPRSVSKCTVHLPAEQPRSPGPRLEPGIQPAETGVQTSISWLGGLNQVGNYVEITYLKLKHGQRVIDSNYSNYKIETHHVFGI